MDNKKVWLITGASRGFGLEITKAALASGDKVVAAVRKQAEKLAKETHHENLHVITLDVSDEKQAVAAAEEVNEKYGRIDVLVNNAGFGLLSAIEEGSDEEIRRMYDTNVFGLLHVSRAFLPYFRKQKSGHIINISSVGGLASAAGWGLYASSKFAVEGISEALAEELKPLGIHVSVVEPGYFRTNFLDATSLSSAQKVIEDYEQTSGKMRGLAAQISYQQPGDPLKLAAAIIKLAAAKNPPVHLPLGNDTLLYFNRKMEKFNAEIAAWHDVITGTDHDGVQ